jgi:hypothetical protein
MGFALRTYPFKGDKHAEPKPREVYAQYGAITSRRALAAVNACNLVQAPTPCEQRKRDYSTYTVHFFKEVPCFRA